MSFQLTQEQLDVIDLAKTGSNMKLSAFAGTGKTSTLVHVAQAFAEQNRRGFYLAFNKAIADEAAEKMPRNVYCSTFHALALSNCPNWLKRKLSLPSLFPKAFAQRYDLRDMQIKFNRQHFRTKKPYVTRSKLSVNSQKYLIDKALTIFMKSAANAPQERHMRYAIEGDATINDEDTDHLCQALTPVMLRVWADYTNPDVSIRIPHDCYLKIWAMQQPILQTDFILFDEAQDADPIMYQILVNQPCQVVYVGDQHQQIYAWRGAVNMMQKLDNLNLPVKNITKSFRFSPVLADYANPVLTYLNESLPLQGFELLKTQINTSTAMPLGVDVVLTRTNVMAISMLFKYAKLGKVGIAKNIDFEETIKLLQAIDAFKQDNVTGKTHSILRWFDDYSDLIAYQEEYPADRDILPTLDIYQNFGLEGSMQIIKACQEAETTGVYDFIVTTAHRAKGLEFDNVLLGEDFEPQFSDKDGLSIDSIKATNSEEFRLLYVAITRAKKLLYAYHITELMGLINQINQKNAQLQDKSLESYLNGDIS